MKRICYSILSFLVVFLMINVSCTDDTKEKEPSFYFPDDTKVNLGSGLNISLEEGSESWSVATENEDIANVEIIDGFVSIIPKKLGKTVIIVMNENKEVIYTCNVEVVKGEQTYKIVEVNTRVQVIDETYKQKIEDEIKAAISVDTGLVYTFIFDKPNGGELLIYPEGEDAAKVINGSFTTTDKEKYRLYILSYEGKEETYSSDVWTPFSKSTTTTITIPIYHCFTKDYTDYFREKYPDAGVYKAQELQIADWSW